MNKCFMLGARILSVEKDKTQKHRVGKSKEGPWGDGTGGTGVGAGSRVCVGLHFLALLLKGLRRHPWSNKDT